MKITFVFVIPNSFATNEISLYADVINHSRSGTLISTHEPNASLFEIHKKMYSVEIKDI